MPFSDLTHTHTYAHIHTCTISVATLPGLTGTHAEERKPAAGLSFPPLVFLVLLCSHSSSSLALILSPSLLLTTLFSGLAGCRSMAAPERETLLLKQLLVELKRVPVRRRCYRHHPSSSSSSSSLRALGCSRFFSASLFGKRRSQTGVRKREVTSTSCSGTSCDAAS